MLFNIDLNDNFVNLNEQKFDVALRIAYRPPQNFSMRNLCQIRWPYCVSREYLSVSGEPQTRAHLSHHKIPVYHCLTQQSCGYENKEKTQVPLQANSSLLLLKAVVNHQVIACLPTYLIGDYIKSGSISPILIDGRNDL